MENQEDNGVIVSDKKDRTEYWKEYYKKNRQIKIDRASKYYWNNRKKVLQRIKDKKLAELQSK